MTESNLFDLIIIDYDPIVYRAGFAVETINKETDIIEIEPLSHAIWNVNSMINKTINKLMIDEQNTKVIGYLTASGDKTNFRYDIFPLKENEDGSFSGYKANRKDARRPIYYQELRDYIIERYGAEVAQGQEADDACSIAQIQAQGAFLTPVICSIDKDFNNVVGWHYNYVIDDLYYMTEIQALRNKYLQILTGDTSDGIPRIKKGWRQRKVEEALEKALTEKEMYEIIHKEIRELRLKDRLSVHWINTIDYGMDLDQYIQKEILNRGRLVHLRHFEEELWEPCLT